MKGSGMKRLLLAALAMLGLSVGLAAKADTPEYHVAKGSVFNVQASDMGNVPFAKPPKVAVRRGGQATVLGFVADTTTARYVWSGEEAPGTYELVVDRKALTDSFVVERATFTAMRPQSGASGDAIAVAGKFFGSECPKVYMEYTEATGKMKRVGCEVQQPYCFADFNGKPGKSVMNVETGESRLTFMVPKVIQATTPAIVVIKCGNGATISIGFNATE